MLKIAIMGHGVVGSGVSELLMTHKEEYTKKIGEYEIKYILDLRDFPGHPLEDRFTKDFQDIVNDDEVGYVGDIPSPFGDEDLDLGEGTERDMDLDEAADAGFDIQDEDDVFGDLLSDDGLL